MVDAYYGKSPDPGLLGKKYSSTQALELGGTQNFKTVRYFIKYHGINNYHGI